MVGLDPGKSSIQAAHKGYVLHSRQEGVQILCDFGIQLF
jgi:hypothetical protein